jgi:putative DNA primase/helicase
MTIDLRTGERYPPRREDYMTKKAGSHRDPTMPIPIWSSFLARITADDQDLQDYLQRAAGYCLTGDIKEHVLFFLYGTGANGKSVFIKTLLGIWGDYACTVPTEVLMESNFDRHPTELARLQGVRLAMASETEQGRRWAESRIKALTGGDKITARFMRQDFFEFTPQFKLMIAGNHRPSLRGVDEAIRRRLHLVPFTVTIPTEDRDPDLADKLKPEWPGIFNWAVEGCLDWQDEGLNPPQAVTNATDAYFAAEDAFNLWREDCTEDDPNAWELSASLWQSWKRWAENAGEFVGSWKRFAQTLEDRGFKTRRQPGTGRSGYYGARIIHHEQPEQPIPSWVVGS